MRWRTCIVLFWGVVNSAWLCAVFVLLFIHGEVIVPEPSRWFAGFEVLLTAAVAGLGVERLLNLKERR